MKSNDPSILSPTKLRSPHREPLAALLGEPQPAEAEGDGVHAVEEPLLAWRGGCGCRGLLLGSCDGCAVGAATLAGIRDPAGVIIAVFDTSLTTQDVLLFSFSGVGGIV